MQIVSPSPSSIPWFKFPALFIYGNVQQLKGSDLNAEKTMQMPLLFKGLINMRGTSFCFVVLRCDAA
jgi:hypothetical protein